MAATVDFRVEDPAALTSLRTRLGLVPGLTVAQVPVLGAPKEQGVADILTVVGGSAALTAAINLLPDFLGSRRGGVKVHVKVGEDEVTIEARNAAEAIRILQRLIGG